MSVQDKVTEGAAIIRDALGAHLSDKKLVGVVVLYSGGNDSTTLAHMATHTLPADLRATHAGHANTTIGVEATREFVRSTCASWSLPLIEKLPPVPYADLVAEQGFPGPAMHFKMYQRLKERGLRQIRSELVKDPRRERVLFLAGRRRLESARRSDIPLHEREGSVIWASPLALWSTEDMAAYRQAYDVPRNPVAEALGMSGECLCGAFAEPGEFEHIAELHPEVAQEIVELEERARHAGVPEQRCQWGWGAYRDDPSAQPIKTGPLCSSCDARRSITHPAPSEALAAVLARRAERHHA